MCDLLVVAFAPLSDAGGVHSAGTGSAVSANRGIRCGPMRRASRRNSPARAPSSNSPR